MGNGTPNLVHPVHQLTDGILLHWCSGSMFCNESGTSFVQMCDLCVNVLTWDKTPPLALANDMWIEGIPLPLRILTLPERILVAWYFPATYIVKLYPKKKGVQLWASTSSLHSALRGNVSTYCVNTDQIVAMVSDSVIPPHLSILMATMGVTFVGPKNLPQKMMPGFLHINRAQISMALTWLKDNNLIYHDIGLRLINAVDFYITHQCWLFFSREENAGIQTIFLNFLKFSLPTHSTLASSWFHVVNVGLAVHCSTSISTTTINFPQSPTSPKSSMAPKA